MHTMAMYARVRRMKFRDGLSINEIARVEHAQVAVHAALEAHLRQVIAVRRRVDQRLLCIELAPEHAALGQGITPA